MGLISGKSQQWILDRCLQVPIRLSYQPPHLPPLSLAPGALSTTQPAASVALASATTITTPVSTIQVVIPPAQLVPIMGTLSIARVS
jgi:hypothetical protein